jgi:hypothetical protein
VASSQSRRVLTSIAEHAHNVFSMVRLPGGGGATIPPQPAGGAVTFRRRACKRCVLAVLNSVVRSPAPGNYVIRRNGLQRAVMALSHEDLNKLHAPYTCTVGT